MSQHAPIVRHWVALGLILLLLGGCGADFDYTPPTEAQLENVQTTWNERDLAAQGVTLVFQDDTAASYQVRIYEHQVEGRKHYGAVTIPKSDSPAAFPVVLYADGLDQSYPAIDIRDWLERAQVPLDRAIFAVPTFRGRTLIYTEQSSTAEGDYFRELTFDAEGDFCDAYDGATDDAIALLNVVAAEVPRADFSRLLVTGRSRGGNIALLLAERDHRVTVAAAQAAPTDFYRQEVADDYGSQYRCQFLTGKTREQSRLRMLASSPLRFPLQSGVRTVYIDHGERDTTVPLWNATEMVSALQAQPVDTQFHTYPGYGHTDLGNSLEFNEEQAAIYESFLAQ